jgi:5-methylcytosine-specific restriction endonuclease McrA
MTARTVPEWSSDNPDAAIPKAVKARVWLRCEGKCALSGRKLGPGDAVDFDHITPLSMGGRHAEGNLQLVCRDAHREKTAEEAAPRAKADRIFAKHNGLWPKSKRPLQGRGFPKRGEATR